ncbi:MAG TPA: hypothetical protein VLC95_02315 [Anaerolineae bacterium]|nr:hypothetical protein [Anaerolineae bacterium]
MRRWALLALLLLLLLAAAAAGTAIVSDREGRLPAPAQVRLEQYVAYAWPGGQVEVDRVDRAAHPTRFTEGLSGVPFGKSAYFRTEPGTADGEEGALAPLFFPPDELWCVLLKGMGPPAGQVVLVALHSDLYNADWIVHQGPADASSVEAQHLLSTLGCRLIPEPGDFDALDRAGLEWTERPCITGSCNL